MLTPIPPNHRTPVLKSILSVEEFEQVNFLRGKYPNPIHVCEAIKDTFNCEGY